MEVLTTLSFIPQINLLSTYYMQSTLPGIGDTIGEQQFKVINVELKS